MPKASNPSPWQGKEKKLNKMRMPTKYRIYFNESNKNSGAEKYHIKMKSLLDNFNKKNLNGQRK